MDKAFKYIFCAGFILVLTFKMFVPVSAVFTGHSSKQIKPVVLLADQENDDEKLFTGKDLTGKAKKSMDGGFVRVCEIAPRLARINLLYHQLEALFKQTYFLAVLTPPPNPA